MKTVKALPNQTLFDISIQYTGSPFNALAIASANGMEPTDTLTIGVQIIIPEGLAKSVKELQYFEARKIVPATGISLKQTNEFLDFSFPLGFPISF